MNVLSEILGKIFHPSQANAQNNQSANTSIPSPMATSSAAPVDVNAILTQLASQKGEKLNWKTSIVDLMKVLDIDSSLAQRKHLATELGFTGDESDTASMNTWLIGKVMQKFADNGGKVPSELLH